ncbi:MAG: TetR/AcrR family transcriptional regulator [Acidimicrobiales bacterium]
MVSIDQETTPSTKRPYLRADARREMILEAAERVIARDGLARLSMIGVAHEARVSRQLIYRHFASRSELLVGLVEHHFSQLEGGLSDVSGDYRDPRDLLRERFARALALPLRDQLLVRSVFSGVDQLEPDLAPGVAQLRDQLIGRWTRLGLAPYGDDEIGRARVWAIFHAVFGLWDLLGQGTLEGDAAFAILMDLVDAVRDAHLAN